jgi:segregation and condensation protein B
MEDQRLDGVVEAILFSADNALALAKMAQVAEVPQRLVRQAIERLNERYEQVAAAFRIEEVAGGYQMLTLPEYHDVLGRLLRARSDSKLSQAAMEALAIVAYRQPIIRADVENIRGVACGEVIRSLIEKNMVKIVGRAEVLGRPMLYGTTRRFLEVFGLASLDDLPRVEELRGGREKPPAKADEPAQPEGDQGQPTEADEPTQPEVDEPRTLPPDAAAEDQ